ncbi:MAG: LpxI family protein [Thalassovita sp.]
MSGRLAILAGSGALPVALAKAAPDAYCVSFAGVPTDLTSTHVHHFEKLGALFADLRENGVTHVSFGGSMSRPPLNPANFDATMMALAPRLLAGMQGGDDALLRLVIEVFEEQGFTVVGAHEIAPDLTVAEGLMCGPEPSEQALKDAERAADILNALAPVDVGQGCVVAGGICVGIETIQGTDALLEFVAETPKPLLRGHAPIFVKAPKRGQDLRVDMPAIGPLTIENAAKAGIQGIVVQAGKVLLLDRNCTLQAAENAGIFILGRQL